MPSTPRLLLNPCSARSKAAAELRRLSESLGLRVVVPDGPGQMADEARRDVEEERERVVVAGGDGSLHHAIQGLAGGACALGIVPLGTGNDLARALRIDRRPSRALRHALEGTPRRIDLGRVGDRVFAGIAGIGFDGEVSRFVNEKIGRLRGTWAYPYAVLRTLPGFEPPRLEIEHDDGAFRGRAMIAALANSPYFGGGMRFAPDARLDDGQLDLVIVERISKLKLVGLFPRVYCGSHMRHPRVRTTRVAGATVRADRPMTIFADGEPLAPVDSGGVRVACWPAALDVIAPAAGSAAR